MLMSIGLHAIIPSLGDLFLEVDKGLSIDMYSSLQIVNYEAVLTRLEGITINVILLFESFTF